jgi:hypothetical protein
MPVWKDIKSQVINSIKEEIYSQKNWDSFKQYFTDETIDEYIIIPLLTKLNIHLKKYVIVFAAIHILLITLILFNIFICLYRKR